MISISRIRLIIFLFLVTSFALGCYLLFVPDNPVMRLFRGEISNVDAKVVIGPYPTESDFIRLKHAKVTTIISLLDPVLPYERTLLDQEKILADKYAIKLMNFPMVSILGYKMGQDYESNANAAANAVIATIGKSYLHCYLGIHRAQVVRNMIEKKDLAVGKYLLRDGERSQFAQSQDEAELLYNQGNYREAKNVLSRMPTQGFSATMLNAWASYRLNNLVEARKLFTAGFDMAAKHEEAEIGLAFCDLKENKLEDAGRRFSSVIATDPLNQPALTGAGLVLFRQSKFDESAKLLQRALAINPNDNDASDTLKRIQAAKLEKTAASSSETQKNSGFKLQYSQKMN